MKAKEMFEELGYKLDKEARFGAVVSYTQYCRDGCCRIYDLCFYNKSIEVQEDYISYKLLQAINKQVEELGWNNEKENK